MRTLLAVLFLWLPSFSVLAQSTAQPVVPGYLTTSGCPSGQTTCFVQYGAGSSSVPIVTGPPKLTAYGTLSVTNSSVALSTLTPGPNSPAWTAAYPSNYVAINNSIGSAGALYVCWLGGTCSASVGSPIAVGETRFRNVASGTAVTVFSTLGATVVAEE